MTEIDLLTLIEAHSSNIPDIADLITLIESHSNNIAEITELIEILIQSIKVVLISITALISLQTFYYLWNRRAD